jgi:small subunit ribosomal protein S2
VHHPTLDGVNTVGNGGGTTEREEKEMTVVTMRKLLEAGVHYGHQTRRWDPRMKANIYAAKNGVHIIDLAKTVDAVDEAYGAMKAIAEKGGRVLFVGTKKQAQAIVMEEALRSGSFHVTQRWLGGTLTNYRTIQKRIRRLLEIEQMEENDALGNYTKKEIAQISKEKVKLDNFLGGIKEMKKLPDAVFVVDPKEDYNAVLEARKLHIPVFGICDTNCDPALVDYAIPGNDDAVKAIKLLVGVMADAIVEAKGGLLEFAYVADEQPEVSMEDVIINVQEVAAENERRRRARFEEKRAQQNARNNRRPRRFENKEAAPAAEAPAASEAIEVAEPVVEATEETNE